MRRRLIAAVAALVAFVGPAEARAQAPQTVGIRLVDAPSNRADDPRARLYIVDHLAPGTTITRRVEVSNDTDATQTVQLYPAAAGVGGGSFRFEDGRAANDLTGWTTVDPPTVEPAPRGKAAATVRIAVPADASPGERYAVVWAELAAAAPAGGGISTVNRVGVRVYLSVGPGGEPASDFAITSLDARRSEDGKPVVAATVRNTGGRALDLSGELRLTKGPGGLSAGPFNADLGTTLGLGQSEPVVVALDPAIPAGPWDATIKLRSGSTVRDATATITFPADPGGSSGPVRVRTESGSDPPWALIAAGAAVTVVLVLWWTRRHRRRRRRGADRLDHIVES